MADDGNPIDTELLDYAATLLAGSDVSIETILNFPHGPTPPPSTYGETQDPGPLPALWAGWSAATRHEPQTTHHHEDTEGDDA
jgi:hypothetical protein